MKQLAEVLVWFGPFAVRAYVLRDRGKTVRVILDEGHADRWRAGDRLTVRREDVSAAK